MDLKRILFCCAFLTPVICWAQSWEQFNDGVISCMDRAAITSGGQGVSYSYFDSDILRWRAMRSNPPNIPPVIAGNTVAVVADAFNTVYAFSKATGKQLWKKYISTSVLASDEKYFYIVKTGYWKLFALVPATGTVAWALQLPDMGPGYLRFLPVHDGLLFVGDFVVDISRRAIVRQWPDEPFYMDSLAFEDDGSILGAGTSGLIVRYDKSLKPLNRVFAGKGDVVEVASAGKQILAMVSDYNSDSERSKLVSLTREGKRLWQIRWPTRSQGFIVIGQNVLTLEPGNAKGKFRLVSRQLSTGKVNWATTNGYFGGRPVLCSSTIYVNDDDRVRGFDLSTGVEMVGLLHAKKEDQGRN